MTVYVPGKPVGKARPRYSRKTQRMYTPDPTTKQEARIVTNYVEQLGGNFGDKPVSVTIHAYHQIPKATSKANREKMIQLKIFPLVKPDVDNVSKLVLDALNSIAYDDDKQVVELHIYKRYGEVPGLVIDVKEVV